MKNILIVVEPQRSPSHEKIYSLIKSEAAKLEGVQEILGTGFLLEGPKAFGSAMTLSHAAMKNSIPIAIFEIENVLSVDRPSEWPK